MKPYEDVTAHKLVADVARAMAEELYEYYAQRDDKFYRLMEHDDFIRRTAPRLRPDAVKHLSEMLGRDDISEAQKRIIHEALIMDRSVPEGATTWEHK